MVQEPLFWLALLVGVPAYWALPSPARAGFLAALSAGLVALAAPGLVAALGVGTAIAFVVLRGPRASPHAATVVIALLLLQLAFFKYLPPFLPGRLGDPLVPLGLSFYTFKLIHYCVQARRGTLGPHRLSDVLAWVFLFPAFTAGPIERFDHFQRETRDVWSSAEAVEGVTRICIGLIKRFVLAELVLGSLYKSMDAAEFVVQLDGLSTLEIWAWLARSFLRLYLDFSGYSDIAVGASLLFGRRIVENFDWPLLSRSPAAFWQRWHISLASWCTNYVYMPVLGLTRRPYVAVYTTFLAMGLWHAGSLQWVLWGLWQGTGVAVSMALGRAARRGRWEWASAAPVRLVTTVATLTWMCLAQAFTGIHGVAPLATSFHVLARLFGAPA